MRFVTPFVTFCLLSNNCWTIALPLNSRHTECNNETTSGPFVFGTDVVSVVASPKYDFQGITGNDVCFVNFTLTHPGTNDRVNNYIALPLQDWNGMFQGIGGGGFAAGHIDRLGGQTALGYAAATTDAGHDISKSEQANALPWALLSPGNVNQDLLLNFGHRSLHEMTLIGKNVTASFYGRPIEYAYWNGCSQGGRQGLTIAQHYPTDYNGILADAPAIQWNDLTPAQEWPFIVQNNEGYTVSPCEFNAALAAVIQACDLLDGVADGIIDAPGLCDFKALSLVGQQYACGSNGSTEVFSKQAAEVIEKIWQGPRTPENEFLWFGLLKGAKFSSLAPNIAGNPMPQPFGISDTFIRGFIAKDKSYDTSSISYADFSEMFLQGHLQYDSVIGAYSPDLRAFKRAGGKMITWQGLADNLIPPQGTMYYYQKVSAVDPSVHDFYRQFYSPGVGHCGGGKGVIPIDALGQLRTWVENGTAPNTLQASSNFPVTESDSSSVESPNKRFLDLCPYPLVSKYNGDGDPSCSSSFKCANYTGYLTFSGPTTKTRSSSVGGSGWYK